MSILSQDLVYLVALTCLPHVGLSTQLKLRADFSNPADVFRASEAALKSLGYLKTNQIESIRQYQDFKTCENTIKRAEQLGVRILDLQDELYPHKLRHTASPPLFLYCRGNMDLFGAEHAIGVVGSRQMSRYGQKVIQSFVPQWVARQSIIVSGMAFGVDSCAHEACLNANGKTIAVQAQGVDRGYPRTNQKYFDDILNQDGLVVSEFLTMPKNVPNEKYLFPRRNRIISGLSDVVVVIEANQKSGALITARYALEQGRDVFAVPGDIFSPLSQGCHNLIKEGAQPLMEANQLYVEETNPSAKLPVTTQARINTDVFETPLEQNIFRLCLAQAHSIDMLIEAVEEQPSFVSATVTKMQIMGKLSETDGKKFIANA